MNEAAAGLRAKLRGLWARWWLRRSSFGGRYGDLKRLYLIEDPWNLASPKERARFEASNAILRQVAPGCRTLLELGSGEGLQTEHLIRVSESVAGLEISPAAVRRAQARLPGVTFRVGRVEDAPRLFPGRRFDVVTALEVLYYVEDVAAVLSALQGIAETLVITSYRARAERMRHLFAGPGWRRLDDIEAEGTVWEAYVWSRAQGTTG